MNNDLKRHTKQLSGGKTFQQREQHQQSLFLGKDHGWKGFKNSQKASVVGTE